MCMLSLQATSASLTPGRVRAYHHLFPATAQVYSHSLILPSRHVPLIDLSLNLHLHTPLLPLKLPIINIDARFALALLACQPWQSGEGEEALAGVVGIGREDEGAGGVVVFFRDGFEVAWGVGEEALRGEVEGLAAWDEGVPIGWGLVGGFIGRNYETCGGQELPCWLLLLLQRWRRLWL